MSLPKMSFRVRVAVESRRRLLVFRRESRDAARLFLPLLNYRGITHDFDLPLKILEAHPPAVTLFVKRAQLRLIGVMIRRAEQRAAHAIARDVREVSFDRLGLCYFDVVEILLRRGKRAAF